MNDEVTEIVLATFSQAIDEGCENDAYVEATVLASEATDGDGFHRILVAEESEHDPRQCGQYDFHVADSAFAVEDALSPL